MSRTFYTRCDFSGVWGLELPEFADTVMFHVVTAGRCWLEVAETEPILLRPGGLALVPHGQGHRLASELDAANTHLWDVPRDYEDEHYEALRLGAGGARTALICGTIRFDQPAAQRLVSILPSVVNIEATGSLEMGWIQSTLQFMASEAREMRPGGETVITRLADILVIQAIRAWIERDPAAQTGWLGALRDPQVGRALTLIHRAPAHDWSVAELADEVALSRSAFAARFNALAGEPPMQYLARWRMQLAQTWLKEDGATIGELAARLGYRSEAAFSRAFKRITGVSPGAVRRESDTGPPEEITRLHHRPIVMNQTQR
jgi:AraC-like DNA-binding protein